MIRDHDPAEGTIGPEPIGPRLLWDGADFGEGCAGVTTPLTWSFLREASAAIQRQRCRVVGIPGRAIQAHDDLFDRMLGLIHGRIHRNLDAWRRVLALTPGLPPHREVVAELLGLPGEAAGDGREVAASTWWGAPRWPRLTATIAWRLLWLRRDLRRFERELAELLGRWRARELDTLPAEDLVAGHRDLRRGALLRWAAPLANDYFAVLFHLALRRRCTRDLCGGDARAGAEYANALLGGQGGLEGTAATVELLRRAARLRAAPWAVELFDGPLPDRAVLDEARREPGFSRWLDDWLCRWGDRCAGELKLETQPPTERPDLVVATLRGYLRGPALDPDHFGEEARRHRARAEAEALRRLTGVGRLHFRWVLRRARECLAQRDRLRALRAHTVAIFRDLFRALGEQMAAAGALEAAGDVVWLEVEEVLGWVEGTTSSTDFSGLVALRRAEFTRLAAAPAPPAQFHTRGPLHRGNRFTAATEPPRLPESGLLRGTPCYPGLVVGPAVVRTEPALGTAFNAPILVIPHADPGWVPLLPLAAGLLVERGGPHAAAAVAARELGIPTIVGIPGLQALVADGQRLRMDGGAGTVRIVERGDGSGSGDGAIAP